MEREEDCSMTFPVPPASPSLPNRLEIVPYPLAPFSEQSNAAWLLKHLRRRQPRDLVQARLLETYYCMDRSPHGVCIIFNNYEFHSSVLQIPDRKGADVDRESLLRTFTFLCYKIEIYENYTSLQMQEVMSSVAARDHSDYDSFVCCILTHGKENMVYGADCILVPISDLTRSLTMCASLISKPKMFFVQACREIYGNGAEFNDEIAVQQDAREPPYTQSVPCDADFFFGYATLPGGVAYRGHRGGSWYITKLCEVLRAHAHTKNLSGMMIDVNRNVGASENQCYQQAPEFVTRLTKQVHFFQFLVNEINIEH